MRVWDLESGTCLGTLVGHSKDVNAFAYSSRGDLGLSASYDKSVRLWDIPSGQCRAVIQGFQSMVKGMAWIEASSSANYLATGCFDGTVGMWKVEANEDHCDVSLHWITMRGALNVVDASIQDAQGLSQLNKQLLLQRGAVGEPHRRLSLRDTSKKLATMTSVVSKLMAKTEESPASTTTTGISMEQLQQWLEQEQGLLSRDFAASIAKIVHKHK